MRQEGKILKSSWPKMVVRKWLNMKIGTEGFQSDYSKKDVPQRRRKSCSDDGLYAVVPEELSEEWLMEKNNEIQGSGLNHFAPPATTSNLDLRMFVGTWNVGGQSPHDGLNLKDWLRIKAPADIYVLGFQEIVPLNAGNVLGPEDCGPASKWLSLIRQALNTDPTDSIANSNCQYQSNSKPRVSFSDLLSIQDDQIERNGVESLIGLRSDSCSSDESFTALPRSESRRHKYCLAASKQMVGIFLCVWVREDLHHRISSMRVSCVGRGIMGYLGNKGSISISMKVHETTFCFVCTHLASGEKESDAVRRNSDFMEILKRTRFSHTPISILDHDKIIWLGDLNYRLASLQVNEFKLLERNDWQALLEKDELRIEQKAGRVFKGWEEGEIYFAPTYKYLTNSDRYVVQTAASKVKRRIPAWCDRILWKGEGLTQMCYVRGESRFSDHRPVYSLFSVQVNLPNYPYFTSQITSKTFQSSSSEEFMLVARSQSCIQSTSRFSFTAQK